MAFAEDLTEFLDTQDGFAVSATIDGNSVDGIFDKEFIEEEGIAGLVPLFQCRVADVGSINLRTSTLIYDGTTYTIMYQREDGTGLTTLVLEEQ